MDNSAAITDFDKVLAQTRFFSGITDNQMRRVKSLCRLEHYPDSSLIYTTGDPVVDLYVLMDGMVRFKLCVGGRQTSAGEIIKHGEVFGWAALIDSAPTRIATAACITSCKVLSINGYDMLALMEQDLTLGYVIMKELNILITSKLTAYASG